jgi:hypothetical protein
MKRKQQYSPTAARCRVKLGHPIADSALGSTAAPLLDGGLGCVS